MQTIYPGAPFRLKLFGFLFGAFGHVAVIANTGPVAGSSLARFGIQEQQAMRLRAEQTLKDVLAGNNGWVRVHAAEALAQFGQAAFARSVFLAEGAALQNTAYRVGVARLLASTATDGQQRNDEIAKIVRIFADPASPDRKQAIESLAKLHEPLPARPLAAARALAQVPLTADSVIPAWALHYAEDDFEIIPLLLEGLQSPHPLLRQRSAYVLRWIDASDPRIGPALKNALCSEPSGTRAHTFILSAALSLGAATTPGESQAWQNQLFDILLTAPAAECFEASHALAPHATPTLAQQVLPLLDSPEPGIRVSAACFILAALRNDISAIRY